MGFLDKVSGFLNRLLVLVGGLFLVGMICLACANIFLRSVWLPIKGTFELMGFFGAVTTAFALGYTQIRRGHISVDVLIDTFSQRTKRLLNLFNSLICMLFFGLTAWQITKWATTLWRTGEVTETLRFAYFPFTYGVAVGFAVLALVFITDFLKALFPGKESAQ